MTVRLTDDVRWLNECYDLGDEHEHVSIYLIDAADEYVLIDSGSFYHRDALRDQIEAATDGEGVDALVLSHSDYPHSANISEFREEWGGFDLIASSGAPPAQGLSDATKCEIGGSMEICGRQFSFIDPPLADRSHTTWIFDHGSDVLFTADGFGNYHEPGECDRLSSELDGGIDFEDVYGFHADTLVWLRYVDPDVLEDVLRSIVDEYEPRAIAPIHGNPIVEEDVDEHLDRLVHAADRIADEYTVPG